MVGSSSTPAVKSSNIAKSTQGPAKGKGAGVKSSDTDKSIQGKGKGAGAKPITIPLHDVTNELKAILVHPAIAFHKVLYHFITI